MRENRTPGSEGGDDDRHSLPISSADNRSYGGVADSSPTKRIHGAFKRNTKLAGSGCLPGHCGESCGLRLNARKDRNTHFFRKAWW